MYVYKAGDTLASRSPPSVELVLFLCMHKITPQQQTRLLQKKACFLSWAKEAAVSLRSVGVEFIAARFSDVRKKHAGGKEIGALLL